MTPLQHLYSLAWLTLASVAVAQQDPGLNAIGGLQDEVQLRTAWSQDQAQPGESLVLAVVADLAPGWHIGPDPSGLKAGGEFEQIPTIIRVVDAPPHLGLEKAVSQEPHELQSEVFGRIPVYEGQAIFWLPVKVRDDAPLGPATVKLEVSYQACDDRSCQAPATVTLEARLPIVAPGTAVSPTDGQGRTRGADASLFEGFATRATLVKFDTFGLQFSLDPSAPGGLVLLLLVAMLGGLLLNFTPCVLPVIPLKILSLSNAAGNRARCLALGAAMSLGVVAFWLGLGTLISTASSFTATNQLFQYPAFTIGIGVVIAVMAVGMCGFFSVGLPGFVYEIAPKHETLAGSFGMGIMTAILSTPCTAPFMGAAAAWAATQPMPTTLTTFAAIGLGMAVPYMVLSAAPGLVRKMPRSGPASQLIKELMGLFLLAAGAYFIGTGVAGLIVKPPDPPSKAQWWVVMGLCAAAGAWLVVRAAQVTPSPAKRLALGAVGLLVVIGSWLGVRSLTAKGPIDWVYYTEARFQEAQQAGQVVVMDFTAEWCLNCKTLEHAVLHSDRVVAELRTAGITPMKVDLTGNNDAGNRRLKAAGSLTIPWLVVYDPAGKTVMQSDAYTPQQVLDAIARARRGTG